MALRESSDDGSAAARRLHVAALAPLRGVHRRDRGALSAEPVVRAKESDKSRPVDALHLSATVVVTDATHDKKPASRDMKMAYREIEHERYG